MLEVKSRTAMLYLRYCIVRTRSIDDLARILPFKSWLYQGCWGLQSTCLNLKLWENGLRKFPNNNTGWIKFSQTGSRGNRQACPPTLIVFMTRAQKAQKEFAMVDFIFTLPSPSRWPSMAMCCSFQFCTFWTIYWSNSSNTKLPMGCNRFDSIGANPKTCNGTSKITTALPQRIRGRICLGNWSLRQTRFGALQLLQHPQLIASHQSAGPSRPAGEILHDLHVFSQLSCNYSVLDVFQIMYRWAWLLKRLLSCLNKCDESMGSSTRDTPTRPP